MVIGLTGKSCSGKNVVGGILKKLGLEVWDLDEMAHEGLEENAKEIKALFGPEVGTDRKAIGRIVFADPVMRTKLEGILYPWLRERILDRAGTKPDEVLVINGALLYRSGFNRLCDCVIYVDASYGVRLSRAMQRDSVTEEAFKLREESQSDVDYTSVDYGVPLYVVSNEEGDMDKLSQQVFNICDNLGIRCDRGVVK